MHLCDLCVCVCFRPPVRVVCPNHEMVGFQPWTRTAPDLGSVTNAYTYYIPPAPPVPTVFWIFVSSSSYTYILSPPPPYFTHQRCLSLYLYLLIPSHLSRSRSDRPRGRHPHPPSATTCLRFPTIPGGSRISLR